MTCWQIRLQNNPLLNKMAIAVYEIYLEQCNQHRFDKVVSTFINKVKSFPVTYISIISTTVKQERQKKTFVCLQDNYFVNVSNIKTSLLRQNR